MNRAHNLAAEHLGELVKNINLSEATKVMLAAGVSPAVANHAVQTLGMAKAQMAASAATETAASALGSTGTTMTGAAGYSTGTYIGIAVGVVLMAVLLVYLSKLIFDTVADNQMKKAEQEAIKQYNTGYNAAQRMPASQDRRYNLPRNL